MAETLLELAERCEKAEGPGRELDETLARLLGWRDKDYGNGGTWLCDPQGQPKSLPRFMASIDAAMTAVPVCPMAGGDRYAVRLDSGFYGATAKLWHECSPDEFNGHAPGQHEALPRALVAAALRARAAQGGPNV